MALTEGEFSVTLYQHTDGTSPVVEFLEELKRTNPGDFAAVISGLEKLKNRAYHREPLCKKLDKDLLELRHVGKLNTRIFWFFRRGRRIVALHGIRNKGQKIPASDLDTARRRMKDWIGRYPDE